MKAYQAALMTFCLVMATCLPKAHGMGHAHAPSTPVAITPSPSPVVSPSALPSINTPQVTVGTITGATPAEMQMIAEGVKLANDKLASECFKQWVNAAHYTETNGMTQAEIWALMSTHLVSADVEMYTGSYKANHVWRTIGYENDPYDGVVHMNRYFVNSAYMVADNLVHEIEGHSQGFHHYGTKATSDPYGMNYAYEGCSNQQQQAPGAPAYKPPGIRLEMRHRK